MAILVTAAATLLAPAAMAQSADPLVAPYSEDVCRSCAGWNEPHPPVHLHGSTYYVGTAGLAALLIASPEGHVLIDGGLPNSAPLIIDNIRALGFDITDVQLIVNSHAHFDHSGGIAALRRASGARVAATEASAAVLESGRAGPDDPQFGSLYDFPPVGEVERIADGETLRVGPLAVTAHLTAGHTPGGTTWSWESCEHGRCLSLVYADSQTPISAESFRFTDTTSYPAAISDFVRGHALLESLPCDILITPHPGASGLWERLSRGRDGLVDPEACRSYAAASRQQLHRRIAEEAARP
jgi:metallo-beta-lactamase class B